MEDRDMNTGRKVETFCWRSGVGKKGKTRMTMRTQIEFEQGEVQGQEELSDSAQTSRK